MTITAKSLGSWTEFSSDSFDDIIAASGLPGTWQWFPADTLLVPSDQVDDLTPPQLTSLSPTSIVGDLSYTTVTITGSNFVNDPQTNVLVDASPWPTTVVNSTTITFQARAGAASTMQIQVRNPNGQTSNALPLASTAP